MKPDQYWDVMWNPIKMRCTRVSPGCLNCWHLRFCNRHVANPNMPKRWRAAWAGGKAILDERTLCLPHKWSKPRTIFVQTMGDLFHDSVPLEWVERVFALMSAHPRHRWLVLTKRPERLQWMSQRYSLIPGSSSIWLGVSVESQATADERIPLLLQTPAAVHWVSAEPLLGSIDLTRFGVVEPGKVKDVLPGHHGPLTGLDWIVAGGESGPHARPMRIEWARGLRDQCRQAEVPFFFKQMCYPNGRKIPWSQVPEDLCVRERPR